MARKSDPKAGAGDADEDGLLSALFAEENGFDRRALLRIGTWGVAAVGAVALAVVSNQSSLGWRRDQAAAADLTRQAQQIQSLAKESQNETRRLAAAIDTLNNDRDRLFSRVTVVEQGLDSVTGAIARQNAAAKSSTPSVSPAITTQLPVPADSQPPQFNPAPSQAAAPAVAAVATTVPAMPSPDKPRTGAAKPADPAPATTTALPQLASNVPAASPAVPAAASPAAPAAGAVKSTIDLPAPALGAAKPRMGPPDPEATKLTVEPAKAANASPIVAPAPAPGPAADAAATPDAKEAVQAKDQVKDQVKDQPKSPSKDQLKDQDTATSDADATSANIQRTEFAVELGGASSIGGLRALWRGLLKSNSADLAELRPIMVLRESNTGLGMQLRLAAGPLNDAAEAAKICAALVETKRSCETTVFDGQRLTMNADEKQGADGMKVPAKPTYRRYYVPKHAKKEEAPPPPPPPESSTLSSLFGIKH